MALLVGPAFAADGVVASRVIPGDLANGGASENTTARATSRTTVSRTQAASSSNDASRGTVTSRSTASRATTSRTTASSSRGTTSRATAGATKSTVSRSTVGDINSNPVVRRAGVVLRPSFADYGGRAKIAGTDRQTGSNIRNDIQKLTTRATTGTQATKESIASAREKMELTAELNKSCQEQYNECMDQFCAIVDANQKRCSCSANLSRYTKVEKAVTEANTKLNEVAQAIRYVGLSADEIRAIMTETEAEAALDDNKDTSTTRNMLKQIESMIKDPTTRTSNYVSENTFGLDMDLTFSSEPLDIFNLDFLNTNVTSTSISNIRGTELYNTAKKRCKTILTQCKDAGATESQITGNYDLAIDKDCIAYEAGLKKMNETLLSNVKSANLMLQKARLAVMQNKNQYDARGCVAALENCMKDDMVCGEDYYKCVDPTKAYIDENGDVVLGQDITVIQSFMTDYNNAAIDSDYLTDSYSGTTIGANSCLGDGKCVVKYLLQKIGTRQKATDEGLCRPVLDKCQLYSYDKSNKYKPYNDIVVNYIQRAMVNIKAAQQKIISDYASNCIIDVATCYNQQVTQVNSWASSASVSNVYSVMRGACRSVALTCGLAIFTGEPNITPNQELNVDGKTYTVSGCPAAGGKSYGTAEYNDEIINCVSNMFYQSLLCPENSTYLASEVKPSDNGTRAGNVNGRCKCNPGYDVWAGACVLKCGDGQKRNSNGACYCTDTTFKNLKNGVCYDKDGNPFGGTTDGGNSPAPSEGSEDVPAGWRVDSACKSAATSATWEGCVADGYRCSGTVPVSSGDHCVNPCDGVSYAKPSSSCTNTNSTNCVKVYCQCDSGYNVSGGKCVKSEVNVPNSITYNCNGGNGSVDPDSCTAGKTVELAPVAWCGTKAGVNAAGWKDSNGNIVTSYICNGSAIFTAYWPSGSEGNDVVNITYVAGAGGTISPTSGTCTPNTQFDLPTATPNSGYVFDGWYSAATGGTQVYASSGSALCDYNGGESVTLYARFEEDGVSEQTIMEEVASGLYEDVPSLTPTSGNAIAATSTNGNYSLVRTADDICLLYSGANTQSPDFTAVADCDTDLNSL